MHPFRRWPSKQSYDLYEQSMHLIASASLRTLQLLLFLIAEV